MAGATAVFSANPFERRFRDMHTIAQQLQGRDSHYEDVGKVILSGKLDARAGDAMKNLAMTETARWRVQLIASGHGLRP